VLVNPNYNGKEDTRYGLDDDAIIIDQNLALAMRPPKWFAEAACREWEQYHADPETNRPEVQPLDVFFPEPTTNGGNHLAPARRICLRCPVRFDCLEFGLTEEWGVWGGHSPSQRRKIGSMLKRGSSLLEASQFIDSRSRDAR
jgi:hypothetical protein